MNNIKQKFTKFIISFCFLLALSACESSSNNNKNSRKSLSSNIVTEIALLLPLSGENELLGKQYAGMIKMGLGDGAKTKIKDSSTLTDPFTYTFINAMTMIQNRYYQFNLKGLYYV